MTSDQENKKIRWRVIVNPNKPQKLGEIFFAKGLKRVKWDS